MLGVLLPATPGSPASRVVGKLEVSGPHFIFGKIKVHVSQSRPAGTRKTLAPIASPTKCYSAVQFDKVGAAKE
jgi:hypothetical protein